MSKRVRVAMSSARARLFQLADLVRESRDETVVILEARGGVEPVALVRESRLAFLENHASRAAAPSSPFVLAGSLMTDLDDDELAVSLRELRNDWGRRTGTRPKPRRAPGQPAKTRRRPRRGR